MRVFKGWHYGRNVMRLRGRKAPLLSFRRDARLLVFNEHASVAGAKIENPKRAAPLDRASKNNYL